MPYDCRRLGKTRLLGAQCGSDCSATTVASSSSMTVLPSPPNWIDTSPAPPQPRPSSDSTGKGEQGRQASFTRHCLEVRLVTVYACEVWPHQIASFSGLIIV